MQLSGSHPTKRWERHTAALSRMTSRLHLFEAGGCNEITPEHNTHVDDNIENK